MPIINPSPDTQTVYEDATGGIVVIPAPTRYGKKGKKGFIDIALPYSLLFFAGVVLYANSKKRKNNVRFKK